MKDNNTLNKVTIWCSVIAILVCIAWMVYQFISGTHDYILWLILLFYNFNILLTNLNNRKNKTGK